ncbi:MAG: NAD+ synthase [Verrucomicrobia bacterium]|nr:NAD+ synthase [Verrucomicrobiota bacterium]
MRLVLAQINTTVGDLSGNETLIRKAYDQAAAEQADLVVMPELTLTGYPPRDLLQRPALLDANLAALDRLATMTSRTGLLVGFVGRTGRTPGRGLTNSVALLADGKIQAVRHKTLLPSYDVFDEDRYFDPAEANEPVEFRGRRLGLTICEDLWNDEAFWNQRRYRPNPAADLVAAGADLLVNLSASPWHLGKEHTRAAMLSQLAAKCGVPLVYCNLVGGNDELVFDGQSCAYDAQGSLLAWGRAFAPDWISLDLATAPTISPPSVPEEQRLYEALVLGTRDYLHKCGFKSAVLGLSGGIDSAVVAVLAVAALGAENVRGLSLPSQYSSTGSLDDARELAVQLGIAYDVVPIQPPFEAIKGQLAPIFAGRAEDTTEENLQARLRGVTLMALSNKFGSLLLTTGNKSELAVGYCTLYGDMCGGLAVISDVPKTWVYRLARWINEDSQRRLGRNLIPEPSITKPPSAELRPNQTDQDSLPPYDVLDAILEGYVVRERSPAQLIADGFDPAAVHRVVRLIDGTEYKRRQAAPGLKVTTKAFGVGRRIPIAQRWREA